MMSEVGHAFRGEGQPLPAAVSLGVEDLGGLLVHPLSIELLDSHHRLGGRLLRVQLRSPGPMAAHDSGSPADRDVDAPGIILVHEGDIVDEESQHLLLLAHLR